MDRMEGREQIERSEKDAQKAKLIFFSLITLVAVILVWSLAAASRARSAVGLELDAARQEKIKLQQIVSDLELENKGLRKKVQQLEAKIKSTSAGSKKKSSRKKTRRKKQVLLYN